MKPASLFPSEETLAINTDLYELTMAAAYFKAGRIEDRVTFELFTRRLPAARSFLVAAGLEQALHFIENLHFNDQALQYLRGLEVFESIEDAFFDYLGSLKFSGELKALPEGTVFFPNEPILQITAPIIEAQILETYLINSINFQTMVASKAARICLAAQGKPVIDFGTRRAHSPQAGVLAARAAFIGGCEGTSNVLAGYRMDIPVFGTMAHSFVQFFDQETEAFERFQEAFPQGTTFLVDTYDTLAGVRKVLDLAGEMAAVRLDSGDLHHLALETRRLLDEGNRSEVRIFASGDLDEEKIQDLADAPIDGFGVGTNLVVSADSPSCNLVYKLVEVTRECIVSPKMKTSPGKATLPHRKQIHRLIREGSFSSDLLCTSRETPPKRNGETLPLLKGYLKGGQLVRELPDLLQIRKLAGEQLQQLPASLKVLQAEEVYPVEYSPRLQRIQRKHEENSAL
ncbi:MAG: nicotinate phosphoribosyltransferase [Acidobacteriota bacterium]|nr:nicotinate phosphoribosyltransferase [Acidobacteriota bacterium]